MIRATRLPITFSFSRSFRSTEMRESGSASRHCLDACGQTRKLARHGVAMHDAFARRALHLRLRISERGSRRVLVASGDRGFHLLDECAHARFARLIALCVTLRLADALARRGGVGHAFLSGCGVNAPPTGG